MTLQDAQELGLGPDLVVPEVVPLDRPHDGVPRVVDTPAELERTIDMLAEARGPVAIDTERASGIRYGQRPFLIQIRRGDSPIVLIDPEPLGPLDELNDALRGTEWIIHAATQDLPSLREVHLFPDVLFDTELGGRLAGFPRVGLGAMTEQLLGYRLAKEHSAADWSKRPLPEPWLVYAALDVELLADLRDAVAEELHQQGKLEWAQEEFEAMRLQALDPPERTDPWRRTKGLRQVRGRRQLTALRNLWYEREHLAESKDIAPKRLMPDSVLVAGARAMPTSVPALTRIPGFHSKLIKRESVRWLRAIQDAVHDPDPVPTTVPSDSTPPVKAWDRKRSEAAALLQEAREALVAVAEEVDVPLENVLTPEVLRRLCWDHEDAAPEELPDLLLGYGARRWQVRLTAPALQKVWQHHADTVGTD